MTKDYKSSISLDEKIGEKLKIIAKQETRSVQGMLRKIVTDYINDYNLKIEKL